MLSRFDGAWWASQLLTIYKTGITTAEMEFDFTDTPGYAGIGKVELHLVMFNCPEWGIGVRSIHSSGIHKTAT